MGRSVLAPSRDQARGIRSWSSTTVQTLRGLGRCLPRYPNPMCLVRLPISARVRCLSRRYRPEDNVEDFGITEDRALLAENEKVRTAQVVVKRGREYMPSFSGGYHVVGTKTTYNRVYDSHQRRRRIITLLVNFGTSV